MKAAVPHIEDTVESIEDVAESLVDRVEIAFQRQLLVAGVRLDLLRGEFQMGEFLIRAGELDARERGEDMDVQEARSRYSQYLTEIQDALANDQPVQEVLPEVLSELRYFGNFQGSMPEAILNNGGSCRPLSHIVASLVYDAGGNERDIFLRYYPPNERGISHVAPILREDGEFFDLTLGDYAFEGGRQHPATQVVEDYARRHGLLDWTSTDDSITEEEMGEGTFPGGAPMFGRRAVADFSPRIINANRIHTNDDTDRLPGPATGSRWTQLRPEDLVYSGEEPQIAYPRGIFLIELVDVPEQTGDVAERRLAEIETGLTQHSRTVDDIETWLRNGDFSEEGYGDGGRVLLLSSLAGMYSLVEENAGSGIVPPEYRQFARIASARRREVVTEARRILQENQTRPGFIQEISNMRDETNAFLWEYNLIFIGDEGIRFYLNNLQEIDRTNAHIRMLSLLSNPPTRQMANEAVNRWDSWHQLSFIRALIDSGVREGYGGDFGRGMGAYLDILNEPRLAAYTAQIAVRDETVYVYNPLHEALMDTISRSDFSSAHRLQSRYPRPDFSESRAIINDIVARHGLGEEWQNDFVIHFFRPEDRMTYSHVRDLNPDYIRRVHGQFYPSMRFFSDYGRWLERTEPEYNTEDMMVSAQALIDFYY
jgi:hypothetical protein